MAIKKTTQTVQPAFARPVNYAQKSRLQRLLAPRLVHHRHSFQLLHWRHTSFPLLLFMLILTAVFSLGWTTIVKGDQYLGNTYQVTAVVPADALTEPALITYPSDGDDFTKTDITVSGTCPDNSYVKLTVNSVFSGMGLCQSNGSWYIEINLHAGANVLQAQDYNVTNQAGPSSGSRTVTYEAPTLPVSQTANPPETTAPTPAPSSGKTKSPPAPVVPLVVSGNFNYQGVFVGQPLQETVVINGGNGPYAVHIDWGDGQSDLSSQINAGNVILEHVYTKPGNYQNSYIIKITVSDANGQTTLLQLLIIVSPLHGALGSTTGSNSGGVVANEFAGQTSPYAHFWQVATPIFASSFIGLGSFWLGQQRVFALERRQAIRLHQRRPVH